MPLDGINKGSEGEEHPEMHGNDPLKQEYSRWAFHGDSFQCYPLTDRDVEVLLMT